MSKLDDMSRARADAMAYATKQIKTIGMDAWEQELKLRNTYGLTLPVKQKDIVREWDKIWHIMLNQTLLASLSVLLDEFDFTDEQLKRFTERYNLKSDCLGDDYHLWQDYADMMKAEHDIEVGTVINK